MRLLSWNADPRLDGCRGSNGNELDKVEYVFPALTGLFNDPLDNPLPIGDERGVPYVSTSIYLIRKWFNESPTLLESQIYNL